MSRSAVSVFVFAIYMLLMGLILIVIPNTLMRLLSVPETREVWIRVVGMLVLILGFYYSHAARNDLRQFFGWTVVARTSVLLFFIAFVVADLAPPILILFGVIDFAAAMWTLLALKSEARA
jgi:hypothetical protein